MRPKLRGSIIFVFSDPGGAKSCLSVIEENNLFNAIAVADRQYSFYTDFKTPVRIINHDFEQLIETIHPELIFTATSYTSDIEKQFIKIAKNKNITCYSFVDHWVLIAKRFEDSTGIMILPDKVWVIDERAKLLAIEQGIEDTKLVISGNPYHDWLKNWKPLISKGVFLKQIGITHQNKKILVFAPEPLSNIQGKEVYGFDELSATSVLVELCTSHQNELKDWIFLIKLHPNQDKEKINLVISNTNSFHIIPDDVNVNSTIYYADVVLGFFSSYLIEADIMNKPVLRFFDKEVKTDPIIELNIGTIVNKDTFIKTLLKI